MLICTRNSDNLVIFAGNDLTIDANGVYGTGWTYTSLNSTTATLQNVVSLPDPFAPEAYEYANGTWTLINASAAAAVLQTAIAAKLQSLGAYATAYEQGGTTVAGQHWDTDDITQSKLNAAYNLAGTAQSPASFIWQMSTGFVSFTKAQILTAAPTLGAWVEAVFVNAHAHASNIEALTTVAAVEAYDFTTGWPSGT